MLEEKVKQEKLARKLSLMSAKQKISSRQVFLVVTDKDVLVKDANTTVSNKNSNFFWGGGEAECFDLPPA